MGSFISKVDLKKQLGRMGIKVEGNYIRKSDIEKIVLGESAVTIQGVTVGDRFKTGNNKESEVVDILEKRSMTTGKVVGYICIAKGTSMASNEYDVPFATVQRHKINAAKKTSAQTEETFKVYDADSMKSKDVKCKEENLEECLRKLIGVPSMYESKLEQPKKGSWVFKAKGKEYSVTKYAG